MRAAFWREIGLLQQAHIERGNAHEDRGLRQPFQRLLGLELGHPQHRAGIEQRAVHRHKQAMHVEDGQRVDQHVA